VALSIGVRARSRAMAKTFYRRITMNRLTACFFLMAFVHCFAQGIMHSFLFTIDSEYSSLLTQIVRAAQMPPKNHTKLIGSTNDFRVIMCDWIPHNQSSCGTIFQTGIDNNPALATDAQHDSASRGHTVMDNIAEGFNISARFATDATNITGVTLQAKDGKVVELDKKCTGILLYPQQHLHTVKREDLTFVIFQFWLFAISLVAMLYNSVPHILAGLGARTLLTGWSIYALWRTKHQERVYYQLVADPGTPCSIDMFPTYFHTRIMYEIPDLILSCTAMIIFSYLSWALLKVYNSQSQNCVGAPGHINRIYKYFLAVQACLQLEAFVLVTAMGLWIDQLYNTYIGYIAHHTPIYNALYITTAVLLIPWITMGWYAIRREMHVTMICFIGLSFVFLATWSIMFYSQVYRWTFVVWPNLGCYSTASILLIIATMVLGVICRMNFGKGLAQYLHAEDALASANFATEVFDRNIEKAGKSLDLPVKSPTGAEMPMPTYYIPTLHSNDQRIGHS
jgi:hypothetical protein